MKTKSEIEIKNPCCPNSNVVGAGGRELNTPAPHNLIPRENKK